MASAGGEVDRRVQRTRQLLDQAAREVVREKGFRAMRVRDIVDRANISRGTFYAHYPDKYALADALVRTEFRRTVTDRLPPAAQWDRRAVRLLVRILLQQAAISRPGCRDAALLRPLIQSAAQEELSGLVSAWPSMIDVYRLASAFAPSWRSIRYAASAMTIAVVTRDPRRSQAALCTRRDPCRSDWPSR
jgi:AcrR family transcriptional regulator